ncbi:MAG: RIP metalloprotease RseP, partial [Gammaproteobacteria bacterium]
PLDQLGLAVFEPRLPALIAEVMAGGSAERAGLKGGDRVLSVDGKPIDDWSAWVSVVRENPGRSLAVVVDRGGVLVDVELTPERVDIDGSRVGRIGAKAAKPDDDKLVRVVRLGFFPAAGAAALKTWDRISMTLMTLGKMVMGRVSVENLSGPITIAQVAADTARYGMEPFVNFLAYLSISLGILNLLPIPVLDGGHILFGLCEWLRGKPLSERIQQIGLGFGLSVLMVFMALAFYNDLMRIAN